MRRDNRLLLLAVGYGAVIVILIAIALLAGSPPVMN